MLRIAINGFGRIGRNIVRAQIENPRSIRIVAVNDLADPATLAYLLEYDSVHGRLDADIEHDDSSVTVNGDRIRVHSDPDPGDIPWGEDDVRIVIEATGRFKSREDAAAHLGDSVSHVIVTAPSKDADLTVCLGVNEEEIDLDNHQVISNASCTTNCLAPLAKIFHESFEIEQGLITTVHSYTNDQKILDLPHQKDPRRGRAAAMSIIPTSTGAAKAVGLVLPALEGLLDGISVRVPTPNVSLLDFTFNTIRETDEKAINALVRERAEGDLKGILGYTDENLVSVDLTNDTRSSIVDTQFTRSITPTMHKVLSWYDNEYGYSNRVLDLADLIAQRL